VATSREAAAQDPPDSEVPYRAEAYEDTFGEFTLAVTVVVIGMALLEVVLLAGPAFAVGARRRRRDLGLVGVAGGDRRHIRTIVLADGVVLGVVAGILGTTLGAAAAWLMRDWFGETSGKRLGHFDARPTELLAVALLGLVIGVVAAWVPAFLAARENVVDSLTGRRGVRHGSKALPITGAALGAVGLGLAYHGARVAPSDAVLLTGCVLAELGLIACCPMLLGAAGRLGRFLPLTPRLALRDAARNRPRTAPAVAAVMAAIAGAVSVTAYWAGTEHDEREQYRQFARKGQVAVLLDGSGQRVDALRRAVEETLPVTGEGLVRGFGHSCPEAQQECLSVQVVVPPPNECPLYARSAPSTQQPTPAQIAAARKDPRCADPLPSHAGFGLPVGDAELVRRITGADDGRIADALRTGAVVFDKSLLHDGKVTVEISTGHAVEADPAAFETAAVPEEPPPPRTITVPGVYVDPPGDAYTTAVLGEEAARATGVAVTDLQLLYDTTEMPGEAAEQRARDAVSALGSASLSIERGYQGRPSTQILLLATATIVVALGAAGVATGLALADSRRDLATLGAVGAPPRVRRTLSAAQSWVIALIGTGLGVVVGLLPAAALRWKEAEIHESYRKSAIEHGEFMNLPDVREIPVIVPWAEMGLAVVLVPLLAAAVAALFTRSRELNRTRTG
ncbi:MAG TPA: FtsX-like permease family protein, partial [Yinghuangia sp.]|nr:FtsX-like permease family protein [Yinghuangia sp.]